MEKELYLGLNVIKKEERRFGLAEIDFHYLKDNLQAMMINPFIPSSQLRNVFEYSETPEYVEKFIRDETYFHAMLGQKKKESEYTSLPASPSIKKKKTQVQTVDSEKCLCIGLLYTASPTI